MREYEDIIHLSRPVSKKPKMSLSDRAAQFAPFAALNGYEDAIYETARIVDSRIELDEETYRELDYNLQILKSSMDQKPEVQITYFIRDKKKEGGRYLSKKIQVKKIEEVERYLVTSEGETISVDDIYALSLSNNLVPNQ